MRLTVHVTNAKKDSYEKKTKDGPKRVKRTFNTLAFEVQGEHELASVMAFIEENELGKPTGHYFSASKIPGRSTIRKK